MRILFIHEGLGQFTTLHNHLNSQGLAHAWSLCTTSVYEANKHRVPNLVPFTVPAENSKTYFYVRGLEARVQRSFYIKKAISELLERTGIDLIVAHGSGGFPLQLFGEFDIPIITYIEFPSFTQHGQDPKYPQPEYARYRDKLFEMASFHQALSSELVIVPSAHAKRMFPECLHNRIYVQMEGFEIKRKPSRFARKEGFVHIGFAARDLSSAKGFEQFVLIAKEILKARQNVRFVFCGSPKTLYSYEGEFLRHNFAEESRPASFMQYVLQREGIDLGEDGPFQHVEFSAYDDFASYVEAMDFFLYPLQHGSANWGLFELLFRGKIIVASNRCFVPEIITHQFNGLLCDYGDIASWARYAVEIVDHPATYRHLGENALKDAMGRFHIKNVAERYLRIFETAVHRYKLSAR